MQAQQSIITVQNENGSSSIRNANDAGANEVIPSISDRHSNNNNNHSRRWILLIVSFVTTSAVAGVVYG